MAVVGEAYILVRAITTEIKNDIAKGFEGVRGQSTKEGNAAGQAFGQGFGNKMRDEATQAARGFHQLMRRGYAIQAGIGTLVGSISALIGGLGALSGALIGAAASGIALVGVMAQIKVASVVGKMAFKGVMEAVQKTGNEGVKSLRELREEMQQLAFDAEEAALSEENAALKLESARETLARVQDLPPNNRARREAELAYKQAELAYRRARDKNNDLQEELANPKKKSAGGSAQDPTANLTKTQKAFANYLKTVQPRLKELREAAASSFLPALTEQMKILFAGGYFEMLIQGFRDVSAGLGKAVSEFGGTLFDPRNKANLAEFFKSTGNTLGTLGRVLGNTFGTLLTVLKAADPLVNRLVRYLDKKTFTLGDASRKNFAQLNGFFKNAGDAAAVFGRFLSNIFQPFKRLVVSQVGPGSPGREFLDWMTQSTERLREFQMGADGLTLNEKLEPMVENTKAILTAFGGFARVLFELGQNTGIAEFFNTLADSTGTLETLLNNMASATGPALANVLVSLLEILEAFSDSGQLQAYFDVLAEIFNVFATLAQGLGALLRILGPATGMLGAFVTSWLLLRKAIMLLYGTWGILRGAIISVITLQQRQIIANKVQLALEAKKRVAAALEITSIRGKLTVKQLEAIADARKRVADLQGLTTSQKKKLADTLETIQIKKKVTAKQAETLAEYKSTLAKNTNVQAMYRSIATSQATAAANGTVAGSFVAQGAAAAGATAPVTAFGVALNAALWPIVAVAAVVALAIGGIALLIGKHNDDVAKATKKTQAALQDTKRMGVSSNEQLRYSQNAWNEALESSWSSSKETIRNVGDLAGVNALLMKQQKGVNYAYRYSSVLTAEQTSRVGAYKEALGNMGKALANIAKKDLKAAQQGFIRFANSTKFSKEELLAQIKEMPEFQKQLDKTAKKYGLVNDKMSEQEKQAVYLDIALNRGAYATAKIAEEQRKLGEAMKTAAASFIDVNQPLEKFTKKGVVDLKGYQKGLQDQVDAQVAWYDNLQKVRNKGISDATYKALINMGKDGADLVKTLAGSTTSQVKEWETVFAKTTPDYTAGLADALTQPEKVVKMIQDKLGKTTFKGDALGLSYQMKAINEQLKSGATNVGKLMADYGITVQDIMQQIADEQPIKQSVTWDGDSIKKAQNDLASKLSGTYTITTTATKMKNGGFVGSLNGFKNGGQIIRKFAPGGQVFGQGGPRSDKIPALLSNGEYVVNAAATARTLPLLNAINYGVTQRNGDASTMVGGGGGSLMNSVNITVNPSPGMDETELAAMVSRELSFQMRRGASS